MWWSAGGLPGRDEHGAWRDGSSLVCRGTALPGSPGQRVADAQLAIHRPEGQHAGAVRQLCRKSMPLSPCLRMCAEQEGHSPAHHGSGWEHVVPFRNMMSDSDRRAKPHNDRRRRRRPITVDDDGGRRLTADDRRPATAGRRRQPTNASQIWPESVEIDLGFCRIWASCLQKQHFFAHFGHSGRTSTS